MPTRAARAPDRFADDRRRVGQHLQAINAPNALWLAIRALLSQHQVGKVELLTTKKWLVLGRACSKRRRDVGFKSPCRMHRFPEWLAGTTRVTRVTRVAATRVVRVNRHLNTGRLQC